MPTEHYRSKEAYRKARAYTHIHGIPTRAKEVVVAGKKHKVKHRERKGKMSGRTKHFGTNEKKAKKGLKLHHHSSGAGKGKFAKLSSGKALASKEHSGKKHKK